MLNPFQPACIKWPTAFHNFTTDSISLFSPMKVIVNNRATSCDIYKKPIPAPREVSGFETACIELDRECKSPTKCCHNGSGYVCALLKELYVVKSVCMSVCLN